MSVVASEVDIEKNKSSYGQILKSSAIIGGSSVINLGFGIVRTKILALLLGPSGVGLIGLFNSICGLVGTLAGMGINSSGVRQIAESVGSGDTRRIALTVVALKRLALILGLAGAFFLLLFCGAIGRLTFGDDNHASSVALLSLAVLFGTVSAGQSALVQGMRRVGDLARLSVLGAFFGTVLSIPIVYFLRENGVALFLVVVAGMGIVTSWWYARKIKIEPIELPWSELGGHAAELLKLGFAFMAGGMMTMGTNYLIRVLIVRKLGVDDAGYYQAAWALSGLYVGFILNAMGADFYPRLTAVASDHSGCNRIVNEQTEIGLLVAVPGILATLAFAPLVIYGFYSSSFEPSIDLLRWTCLGMLLRVASWPMGFIMLAKGARVLFIVTETISNVVYIGLVWAGLSLLGLLGTGVAFFGLYAFYIAMMFFVTRRLTGFCWSPANIRLGLVYGPVVAVVFLSSVLLPPFWSMLFGMVVTLIIAYRSLIALSQLVTISRLPKIVQRFMVLLRIIPEGILG